MQSAAPTTHTFPGLRLTEVSAFNAASLESRSETTTPCTCVSHLGSLGTRRRSDARPGPAMSPIERVVIRARTRAGAGQSGSIILQLLQQALHVGGQRRLPLHRLAALGVDQRQLGRMQRLARERQAVARAAPIDGIAHQ